MPSLQDLPNETLLHILDLTHDWRTVTAFKSVNRLFRELVSSSPDATYKVQLSKGGLRDAGDASSWTKKMRSVGAEHYNQALNAAGTVDSDTGRIPPSPTMVLKQVSSRHCYFFLWIVCVVDQSHMMHIVQLGNPLCDRPTKRFTPEVGCPLIPNGALAGTGISFGDLALETVVIDVVAGVVMIVFLTHPTSTYTGVVVVPVDISSNESWQSSFRPAIYDPTFVVQTRDLKQCSRSMCARDGKLMFAAIEQKPYMDWPNATDLLKRKAVYVWDIRSGRLSQPFFSVLAATMGPSGVIAVTGSPKPDCAHRYDVRIEVYSQSPSSSLTEPSYTIVSTLGLGDSTADKPQPGVEWFLLGTEVGFPFPQRGILASAGAFGPDSYSILRLTYPHMALGTSRVYMPGISVPYSTIERAVETTTDPHAARPVEDWSVCEGQWTLQLSDHSYDSLQYNVYSRPRRSIIGAVADNSDFHPQRVLAAVNRNAKADLRRAAHENPGRQPDPLDPLSRFPAGSRVVRRDGFHREEDACCFCKHLPDSEYVSTVHPEPLPLPRNIEKWASQPPEWVEVLPSREAFSHVGGDVLIEYPGSALIHSVVRGSYVQFGDVTFRTLTQHAR